MVHFLVLIDIVGSLIALKAVKISYIITAVQ